MASTVSTKALFRIFAVSLLLAVMSSYGSWHLSISTSKEEAVALTIAESRRLQHDAEGPIMPDALDVDQANHLIKKLIGGIFDVAELYTSQGQKLAVGMTKVGLELESSLYEHRQPEGVRIWSELVTLPDERQILRVVVPLKEHASAETAVGYFEGIRLISTEEQMLVLKNAWIAAFLGGGAALLCGFAVYPFVVSLGGVNSRKSRELLASHLALMEALGRTIELRDEDTGGHNYRVAWIASQIGQALGLTRDELIHLIVGSFLHDVGKIGIPDAVLLKPDRLNDTEYLIMQGHVDKGEGILAGIEWLEKASVVVSGHHERWDGTGYPRGLEGESIPLLARIFAVADVFDALCSKRPYKGAYDFNTVMSMLRVDSGRHFDPAIIQAFIPMAREIYDILADCKASECQFLLEQRVSSIFSRL